ncbi:MAG TPA: hypothetical protein VJC07_03750 [Candidatus Nanoarchaeia archaeon]|nr:hypothetical protein [Candidatus Nanoarchaeia archaeon]
MKVNKFIILVALLAAVASASTYLFYNAFIIQDVEVIEFDVNVANYSGFNLDKDKMHFGAVMPGTQSRREITITAKDDQRVTIKVTGVDFVYPKENDFRMAKGESRSVLIIAAPYEGLDYGFYEGEIRVISKR